MLTSHGSPSQIDPKNQAKQLPHHSNSPSLAWDALVLGPSADLNRDPTPVTIVNNTSQTVPQPCVSQQSTTSDSSKNKASRWKWQRELLPLKGHQQGPLTSQSGPYLKNGAEKIRWISPIETSLRLFHLYQELNRCPSTIDTDRMTIVDTLGPACHISQFSDLNRLLSSFHRDCPKSSRNLPK